MFHRQAEVKFRDDQENRVQQFPKTPKNAAVQASSRFVTPAPKPRVALGAKSTNVHHRQFTSAKTGKRHSPVAAPKLSFAADQHEPVQELRGGDALRAALQRALATGVDIPDVEYTPPPVQELPYSEPEGLEPMDWDALRYLKSQGALEPRRLKVKMDEPLDVLRPFEFIDPETHSNGKPSHITSLSGPRSVTDRSRGAVPSRLGGFAAPTAAARARAKVSRSVPTTDKGNRDTTTSRPRPVSRPSTLSRASSSTTAHLSRFTGRAAPEVERRLERLPLSRSASSRTAGSAEVDTLSHIPDFLEPLPYVEVEFDIDDES